MFSVGTELWQDLNTFTTISVSLGSLTYDINLQKRHEDPHRETEADEKTQTDVRQHNQYDISSPSFPFPSASSPLSPIP